MRRFIDSLADGEAIEEVYLVSEKHIRSNRNGTPYLTLELRDKTGTISARMWGVADASARSFEIGDFLSVRGKVQLFQGSLQMVLSHFERTAADKLELKDFLAHTDHDIRKLVERLRGLLLKLSNPHLRALCETFLFDDEFMKAYTQVPAGVRLHHAYVGGLLEHVVTMLEVADRVAPLYPGLDRDLLLVGVFLHDAGKTRELHYGRMFGYTTPGQLVGHLAMGLEMLAEKIPQVSDLTGEPFPPELLLRIKHMILSHHGTLEFGSPKVPMTPEAVALHHIDMLDVRIHAMLREIKEDRTSAAWTPFNQTLGRKVYKGGDTGGAIGSENADWD